MRRGVGHRRARDRAEEGGGQDVDQRQPAADEAHQHAGEGHQPPRHAALGHDGAGQHEERNRQQRELVDAGGDLDHHRVERDVDPQRADQRRQAERSRPPARRSSSARRNCRAGRGRPSSGEVLADAPDPQCASPKRTTSRRVCEPNTMCSSTNSSVASAAQRHRQVGDAHRHPGQLGDGLAHRLEAQPRAVPDDEAAHQQHQQVAPRARRRAATAAAAGR